MFHLEVDEVAEHTQRSAGVDPHLRRRFSGQVRRNALEQGLGRALLRGPALAARRRLEPMFFLTIFSNFDF